MGLIDKSKLKELTNDEIKNLIAEVLEEIKYYKKILSDSRKRNTVPDSSTSLMQLRTDYITVNFDSDDFYKEELDKRINAVNDYIEFYGRRLKFEELKKEEIYHNFKCQECNNPNDLNLSGYSDVCLEFRGVCHYCGKEIDIQFSKDLY